MLKRMKVATRMASVFALIGAFVVGLGGLAAWQITSLLQQLEEGRELLDTQVALKSWEGHTAVNAARTVALLQSADVTLVQHLAPAMKKTSAQISEVQKRVEALPLTPEERAVFKALGAARADYLAARDETLKRKAAGDAAGAATLHASRFVPALEAYQGGMTGLIEGYGVERLARQAAAEASSRQALTAMAGAAVVFVLLAVALVVSLTRSITKPVAQAVALANSVADGNLTATIRVDSQDELGELARALQRMNANLERIVGSVRASSDAIGTASRQIASGNADLSQRTEEQASSLEETASSMEELTSTVRQNAENARHANQLAAGASEVAVRGGEVVGQVVQTMSSINESSRKIVDIISVIDGIAFQTNILALNAAVEAARAGEQGRGFAVVASEVRTLAQRSAAAAKEIKQLISDSVGKVDAGTRLVDQAGSTMNEIVTSVKRVTDIMAEISAATGEQSSGIEQVSRAVTQMDEVTQQNAALVEEAAAAAESMKAQAHTLMQAVAIFRLAGGSPLAVAASAAPAERRGPDRARNVARLSPTRRPEENAAPARAAGKTGTTGDWAEF